MSEKQYVVTLTVEERSQLENLTSKGTTAARKIKRAYALLKCDQGPQGPRWTDQQIAEAFDITPQSLEKWRKQAVLQGPLSLLERQPRQNPPVAAKLDGEGEARLITLACSQPPQGRCRWTLALLAEQLVRLDIVESISLEAVRQVLKKRATALA